MDSSAGSEFAYILVIEDDPQLSEIIRWVLEDEGWSTDAAWDGEQGVAKARHREPALVVLDMNLPKLHGEAVADRLHLLYHSVPILVVSANQAPSESARKARAFAYLKKPFDLEALISCVRTGLTSGRDIQNRLYPEFGRA